MDTFEEMIDKLKQLDEITLIELLNLSSEEIIDRTRDLIENDRDYYERQLQDFFPSEETEDSFLDQN